MKDTRHSPALVLFLWLVAMAIVSGGELLPGRSATLRWVASSGVNDKLQHFAAYFLLAAIPAAGLEALSGVLAGLSMIAFGVLLEFCQRLVPGRDFELLDMAVNAAGVLTGIALGLAFRRLPVSASGVPGNRN